MGVQVLCIDKTMISEDKTLLSDINNDGNARSNCQRQA